MNAREIALRIINEIQENAAYANVALSRMLTKYELSDQDRRFITELVYGTTKLDGTLAWMVSRYTSRPLKKIAPVLQNILKLGFYQLFFMDKIPASAACNQSVELAKKYGHSGTVKFVNAVLRSATRNPEKADFANIANDRALYLSLKYYHPLWLIKRWLKQFGEVATIELCDFNNRNVNLSLRTNTLKISRNELMRVLTNEGAVCSESPWTPEGIVCSSHQGMQSLVSLKDGLCQVQDESSMLVAHILGAKPGEFIIDTCSAPGGKTTHIAALMQNSGKILATDIYEHKLARIQENAQRLGIDIIETKLLDATEIGSLYPKQADRVLVDAPCSGLGVLRRRSDARWRKTPDMLDELPKLQLAILRSAAAAVKPGGTLVYSTCTITDEENVAVINEFLESAPEFSIEATRTFLPNNNQENPSIKADMIQLLPQHDNVDGFFIARLRNKGIN